MIKSDQIFYTRGDIIPVSFYKKKRPLQEVMVNTCLDGLIYGRKCRSLTDLGICWNSNITGKLIARDK